MLALWVFETLKGDPLNVFKLPQAIWDSRHTFNNNNIIFVKKNKQTHTQI